MKKKRPRTSAADPGREWSKVPEIERILAGCDKRWLQGPLIIEEPSPSEMNPLRKSQSGIAGFRIGELLAHAGLVNEEKVKEALMEQKKKPNKKLGQILVESGSVDAKVLDSVLKIQRKLTLIMSILLFSSLVQLNEAGAGGHTEQANLHVSAFVKDYVRANVIQQETEIYISEEDIREGFVEIKGATRIEIKTNSRIGCILIFDRVQAGIFKEAIVTGTFGQASIGPEGGMVFLKGQKAFVLELDYKFLLEKGVKPGRYPWPLSLTLSNM